MQDGRNGNPTALIAAAGKIDIRPKTTILSP
jgi:hypothetical protein